MGTCFSLRDVVGLSEWLLTCLFSCSAFFTYGTFCFTMFIFVWFLVPETKGLSLERMDDLFGVTELVKDVEGADASPTGRRSPSANEKTGVEQVEISRVQ